jgi:hypothetical protein
MSIMHSVYIGFHDTKDTYKRMWHLETDRGMWWGQNILNIELE